MKIIRIILFVITLIMLAIAIPVTFSALTNIMTIIGYQLVIILVIDTYLILQMIFLMKLEDILK